MSLDLRSRRWFGRTTVSVATLLSAPGLVWSQGPNEGESSANEPRPVLKGEDFAPSETFADIGGNTTHFVESGQGRPAIVLIHGFGSNTETWRNPLEGHEDRYRVAAFDLKGFGLTETLRDGPDHVGAVARHLLGFLDEMDLERLEPVSNSMGGSVALDLALANPERVAGLVLVDSMLPDFRPPRLNRTVGNGDPLEGRPGDGRSDSNAPGPPSCRSAEIQPSLLRLLTFDTRFVEEIERSSSSPDRDTDSARGNDS